MRSLLRLTCSTVLVIVEIAGQADLQSRWPNGVIPYNFAESYSSSLRASVRAAIDFWERRTCVRFREGNATDHDRVQIVEGIGCFSQVGREGNVQNLSISDGCDSMSKVTHELMHLMGVHHTHQRPDRENYVHVVEWNILPGAMSNFEMLEAENVSSLEVPYDYGSILHYDYYTMSVDREHAVLVSRDPRYRKSMGNYLPSFYDPLHLKKEKKARDLARRFVYSNAYKSCEGVEVRCQNGGVQDVNDCTRCRCPAGFGGLYCAAPPDGCFFSLNATNTTQEQLIELGRENKTESIQFEECLYEIQAHEGMRAAVSVKAVTGVQSDSCQLAGLEILTQNDTTFSGPRLCRQSDAEQCYISEGRRLLLKLYNRSGVSRFLVAYTQIV